MIINNALNEVCHGVDLEHDGEFASRVGATRSEAQTLLATSTPPFRSSTYLPDGAWAEGSV